MKHGKAKTKIGKELKYGNYVLLILKIIRFLETYQLPSTYTTKIEC